MTNPIAVRPIKESDFSSWLPLWDGYNAFYGKVNETALDPEITKATWQRFFDPAEPVFCLVAEADDKIVGITHFLYHRSTSRLGLVTYLQDLFTEPSMRGKGVGRALINGVYAQAKQANQSRVYWQTHETNAAGRILYDKVAKHAGFLIYGQELQSP
jgi:GNAT superfamily N-acetyltransferase